MIASEHVLTRALRDEADRLSVPGGDLGSVLARADRRGQRRRRLQASSLGLVGVLLAGAVAVQVGPDRDRHLDVSAADAVLQRGKTGVVWRLAEPDNALGSIITQAAGRTLYALSTAPGPADPFARTAPPTVLYSSTDGVNWTPAGPAGGASFLADLSASGDRLYAVGTTTAPVVTTTGKSVAELGVHWTDDGARTWHRTRLNVDLAGLAAKATSVHIGSMSIAAGSQGVVAVAAVSVQLDLAKVLPAGTRAPNGWAVGEAGLDILGNGSSCPAGTSRPSGAPVGPPVSMAGGQVSGAMCLRSDGSPAAVTPQQAQGVERSFTWAELNVSGDLLAAVRGTPLTFWSTDGDSFERVEVPLALHGGAQVAATDDGFAMVAQSSGKGATTAVVLRSADGRRWSPAAEIAGRFMPMAVGQLAGGLAVLGYGDNGPTVAIEAGAGWRTGRLVDVVDPRAADPNATSVAAAAVGPLGVAAVVQVRSAFHVVFSPDGLTWSSEPLAGLVDGPVGHVSNVVVTDSRIIVTVAPPTGPGPAGKPTVLIGTV